jgi:hypothetical protein
MRASTKWDRPEGEDTAIATRGLWLLSSDPCSVGIRLATRAERGSLADADQVERAVPLLGHNLPVGGLGRLSHEGLFCSNVDEDVVTLVTTLEVDPVALVDSATGLGDLQSIERGGLGVVSTRCSPLPLAFARS